jgi:Leucine-rich repeat (LRR) protein
LAIDCEAWKDLDTTNVVLPRRIFNTFDIIYIELSFDSSSIHQIPSPAISSQMASKLGKLSINRQQIDQIDPGALNGLPNLKSLNITSCNLNASLIRPELTFCLSHLNISLF